MLRSFGGQLNRLSVASSSHRAYTSGFRSWAAFRGLIGEAEYFDAAASDTDKIQELLEFVAWFASEGNPAGTTASKLSAVLQLPTHQRTNGVAQVVAAYQACIEGVTRSHVAAGTPKRVRRPISCDWLLEGQGLALSWGLGGRVIWLSLALGYFFCAEVGRNLRLAGRSGAPCALLDEERRGAA